MLKIRIYHADEGECEQFVEALKHDYKILSESSDYKDRNGEYQRRYLEIEQIKRPVKKELSFKKMR